MAMTRLLSHSQAARFYDLLGARLDTQAFYEAEALRDLVAHLELETCRSVMEFGFGTGRLAAELLSAHLPPNATYFGLDVSATMNAPGYGHRHHWGPGYGRYGHGYGYGMMGPGW